MLTWSLRCLLEMILGLGFTGTTQGLGLQKLSRVIWKNSW